jgi:hypothetical protein
LQLAFDSSAMVLARVRNVSSLLEFLTRDEPDFFARKWCNRKVIAHFSRPCAVYSPTD